MDVAQASTLQRSKAIALSYGQMAWLAAGLILAARLWMAVSHPSFLGVDVGAYLLSRNAVLGEGNWGLDFTRPPLAPGWLLVPFTTLWGDQNGYAVFQAVGGMAPYAPFWLLVRRFLSPCQAFVALLFVMVDFLLAQMFVTGVLPLIGFAWVLLLIWGLLEILDFDLFVPSMAVMVSLPMIAYTNMTAAGITAVLLPVFLVLLRVFGGRPLEARTFALPLVVGGLLAFTALPYYLGTAPAGAQTRWGGDLWAFEYVQAIWAWILLVSPWLIAAIVTRKAPFEVKVLAVICGVCMALAMFKSADETLMNLIYRPRYLAPFLYWPILVWVACHYWPKGWPAMKRLGLGLTAAFLCLFTLMGYTQFHAMSRLSDQTNANVERALALIPKDAPVITNSSSLTQLIAGRRPTMRRGYWMESLEPPPAQKASDELVRCILGWVPGCDQAAAVEATGARYVLVESKLDIQLGRGAWWGMDSVERGMALLDESAALRRVGQWGPTVKLWEVTGGVQHS